MPEERSVRESVNHYLESVNALNQSAGSSTETDSVDSKIDESSWNERFQRIYSTNNSLEKYLALGKLVKDFVDTAQTYVGRLLLSFDNIPQQIREGHHI